MKDLIERVKKLTGPSREIDAEIMFDLYAKPVGASSADGGPTGYIWPDDDPSWSFGIRFPGKDREWFAKTRVKHEETLLVHRDGALVLMNYLRILKLTESIDEAATLLLPDYFWSAGVMNVARHKPEENRSGPTAFVWRQDRQISSGYGATVAIALVIAALEARRLK